MRKVRLSEVTVNLDSKRKPLNNVERNRMKLNPKYPYFGANGQLDMIDDYIFDEEIICIAEDGGNWSKGSICSYIVNEKCWVNNHAHVLKTKKDLNIRFLMYYLNDADISSSITGTTRGKLTKSALNKIEIPLPSPKTQKKIVEVLDKAQELIDARKEQIRLMDELIQSVFYDMFGDPVTNPKGWEVGTVEKVCANIMGGGTPSKSNLDFYVGDIPWVTPKDMKIDFISDSMDHINEDAINNSSAKLIPENSVLMVIRSGILKRKLPVAINKRCVAVNQDMKAFIINKNFTNSEFFMYFWKSCEKYILSKVRAVTADNIEFKQIKDMQYILPPCELQNEFSEKVQQIQTNKTLLEMSLCELENTLSGFMESAFDGSLFDDLVLGK